MNCLFTLLCPCVCTVYNMPLSVYLHVRVECKTQISTGCTNSAAAKQIICLNSNYKIETQMQKRPTNQFHKVRLTSNSSQCSYSFIYWHIRPKRAYSLLKKMLKKTQIIQNILWTLAGSMGLKKSNSRWTRTVHFYCIFCIFCIFHDAKPFFFSPHIDSGVCLIKTQISLNVDECINGY